jgi:hypothetical protein
MKRHPDGRFRGNRAPMRLSDRKVISEWVKSQTVRLKRMGVGSFDTIAELLTKAGRGDHVPTVVLPENVTFPPNYRISKVACCKAYRSRMEREPSLEAEEHRRLDTERCEEMFFALQANVRKGDPKSVEAAIRVLNHKAEINGLKSPARVEMTGKDGGPMSVTTFRELCEEAEKEDGDKE